MDFVLRHHLIRTLVALCRLAARADADDVRDDLSGECADALEIWAVAAPDARAAQLRHWCGGIASLLERLHGQQGVDPASLARAQVMLLRLQTELPQPQQEVSRQHKIAEASTVRRGQSVNRIQVLEAITATPEIRTRELVERLRGVMAPRTVKRLLAELTASGAVTRVEHEDRTVSYSPTT